MATATYTAVLFARKYGSSVNTLSERAAQGAYSTTGRMVGIINFAGLNMTGKVITGITFVTTCTSQAGGGNASIKTLYFKKSTVADPNTGTSGNGSTFIGDALGTLTGNNFYNASNVSRVLDTGSDLFKGLKSYLQAGAHALVLYALDDVPSSGYSENYLYIDGLKIVLTYEEGLVYFGASGVWSKCQVYWPVNEQWVLCIPFFVSDGVWHQCGG